MARRFILPAPGLGAGSVVDVRLGPSSGHPVWVRGLLSMCALDLVKLTDLMERSRGNAGTTVGLIDGPVAVDHPDLAAAIVREIPGRLSGRCVRSDSVACGHGTFVAGVLSGKRGARRPPSVPVAPCWFARSLRRPVPGTGHCPMRHPRNSRRRSSTASNAGVHVVNLSLALARPSAPGIRELDEAIDYALRRGVLVVAAAGNQGAVGSSTITRHPWVIPVAACDLRGRPTPESNLGSSIGTRGLRAPGEDITSLGAAGPPFRSGGTSVAAAFVTGAVALLWSEYPAATAAQIKLAVTGSGAPRRATVVPSLLNAWAAYQAMSELSL